MMAPGCKHCTGTALCLDHCQEADGVDRWPPGLLAARRHDDFDALRAELGPWLRPYLERLEG